MVSTQRKGDYAVSRCIATFTGLGYNVSIPLTESAPYDLIIEKDGVVKRVQVKYTSNGTVDLRHVHSNSKGYVVWKTPASAYDWLYILSIDEEYLVTECLVDRSTIKPTEKHKIFVVLESCQSGLLG